MNWYSGATYYHSACAPKIEGPPKLKGPPMRVKKGEVYENDGDRSEVVRVRVRKNTVVWRKLGGVQYCQHSYTSDFSDWVRHKDTRMVRNRHRKLEKKR